mmetsp:Transcript_121575/g.315564  ORF Transcript_121575/g.315564 Transcript_121575/m.315564 type:complete len:203 (+) Transcript_121575:285-893(+)
MIEELVQRRAPRGYVLRRQQFRLDWFRVIHIEFEPPWESVHGADAERSYRWSAGYGRRCARRIRPALHHTSEDANMPHWSAQVELKVMGGYLSSRRGIDAGAQKLLRYANLNQLGANQLHTTLGIIIQPLLVRRALRMRRSFETVRNGDRSVKPFPNSQKLRYGFSGFIWMREGCHRRLSDLRFAAAFTGRLTFFGYKKGPL